MKKIMFICSGNTCRSPLAEGLFKKYLKDNNIKFNYSIKQFMDNSELIDDF